MRRVAVVAWVMALAAISATSAAGQADLRCQRCHGELELLRQHVPTLSDARRMMVLETELDASAHRDMTCVDCHTGFARFPHPAAAATSSCESCHSTPAAEWRRGVHAGMDGAMRIEGADPTTCTQCHGVHSVADRAALATGPELTAMNERCTACHELQRLPAHDPHGSEVGSVGCHACHAPHEALPPREPEAWMAGHNQARVCGACHEDTASRWTHDVHGRALLAIDPAEYDGRYGADGPPTCASCHGAHPTTRADDRGFSVAAVDRCIHCHTDAGRTYFNSYHGKATALGSVVVATCVDCHSAHRILPASDPRSTVASENLVETCKSCHEYARPAFVLYDSHPDPLNRARNPYIFFSFWFMNSLLIGTLTVFGLHTLAWWVRIMIDRRRGIVHGPGQGHGRGREPGLEPGPEPGHGGTHE